MAVTDTYTFQNGESLPRYPYSPTPISFDINHRTKTLVTDARSGRRVTRKIGGERIEMTLKYPPMDEALLGDLLVFLRYVGGRNEPFALRMPILTEGPSGYSDASIHAGEYYNLSSASLTNQLVQYSGSAGIFRPPAREGLSTLRAWSANQPHLRCSLNNDVQVAQYGADGFVRLEVDVVERW